MIHIRHQADRLPSRLIFGLAGALVGSVIAGALAAMVIARCGDGGLQRLRGAARPDQPLPAEVNEIELTPFELPTEAELSRDVVRTRLDSYGWIDRQRGIVRIPIDRAIDLYLEQGRQP